MKKILKIIIISSLILNLYGCGEDERGFNPKTGVHSITKTKYDSYGYNIEGYNLKGYDKGGFNSLGYNIKGFDREGYDKEGYDFMGFDRLDYDKNGYNKLGFDKKGYNKQGYTENGFDYKGINKITKTKYGKDGYDVNGYDKQGYTKDTPYQPTVGMDILEMRRTRWGWGSLNQTIETADGKAEYYTFGDNKMVLVINGIVSSIAQ